MESSTIGGGSLAIPRSFSPNPYAHFPTRVRVIGDLPRRRSWLRIRVSTASSRGSDPVPVEVIGIGSRKDAFMEFCLKSSSSSSRFRFWTIHMRDSTKVQLLQKHLGTDMILRNLEFPLSLDPCPAALILVASTGHCLDHIAAIELLTAAKSAGGLTVAILLKPFRFEGQRRQEEVDNLVTKIQECSHINIVVEADSLLDKDVETLAEALESMNNAVFLAINSISVMISETHVKHLSTPEGQIKEVRPSEVLKLLESYGEAKVGFGAGYNVKVAITQAVSQCPFLDGCIKVKDSNGLVIFTIASASVMDESDVHSIVLTFRGITECATEIIFSRIHEPDLEQNLILTTILVVGCIEKKVPHRNKFWSALALQFPFVSSFLGRGCQESEVFNSSDIESMSSLEVEPSNKLSSSRSERSRIDTSDYTSRLVSGKDIQKYKGIRTEQSASWNIGPGFFIAQMWAKERATFTEKDKIGNLDVFTLPVGVKSSQHNRDRTPYSDHMLPEKWDSTSGESLASNFPPSGDAGFEAFKDMYNSAIRFLQGKTICESKRGLLSVRAESMLEAERESQKSWTPLMEIQYRGGMYRGQCQGGLPEGKGRLIFVNGSFYDGMWRSGKRSGFGTFCYSNGDVFQGTWRDDHMHGKGWFYFHTGDRWFSNFWKGKANGEGRFYSKDRSAFFGYFQNGWRHGQGLRIDADGLRWREVWDEGLIVSRTQLRIDEEMGG